MSVRPETIRKAAEELARLEERRLNDKIDSLRDIDMNDFDQFFKSLADESDRAVAVINFTYIDDVLTKLMKLGFHVQDKGKVNALFELTGPLTTSDSRIQICEALSWISSETARHLHLLRKIRNEFAHGFNTASFGIPRIKGYIDAIGKLEQVGLEDWIPLFPEATYRQRLIYRSIRICYTMIQEVAVAPISLREGFPPSAVLANIKDPSKFVDKIRFFGTKVFLEIYIKDYPELEEKLAGPRISEKGE